MGGSESKLFCRLDGFTQAIREQQRFKALVDLGILKAETIPVFEEATQTTARFLEAPISLLSLMAQDRQWIKSAVGLSTLGLMNDLATSRQLLRSESFCAYVVDSHQALAIDDTATEEIFAKSSLFQHYGVRAYLGAPLLTSSGECLGTLAVMDLQPRQFTTKDIDFLVLMTRWVLSEVERNRLVKDQHTSIVVDGLRRPSVDRQLRLPKENRKSPPISTNSPLPPSISKQDEDVIPQCAPTHLIKVKLLTQISQELRTPLTSVMGMTSVLNREIYGPLSSKQKEYLNIIHGSGQQLVSLVDEISALGILDGSIEKLNRAATNLEMLGQQAVKNLEQVACNRQQQIRFSIEPGNSICWLDKDKVRLMLYYLILNVIESVDVAAIVSIHVYYSNETINIAVWGNHSCLKDWSPRVNLNTEDELCIKEFKKNNFDSKTGLEEKIPDSQAESRYSSLPIVEQTLSSSELLATLTEPEELSKNYSGSNNTREHLGLLLSCQIAELHGGKISVQSSPEWGYRYVASLPARFKA